MRISGNVVNVQVDIFFVRKHFRGTYFPKLGSLKLQISWKVFCKYNQKSNFTGDISCNQKNKIVEHAWSLSKTEKGQLIKKFQLANFLTVNNKSLNFHQVLVCFQKDVYKVDVRTEYLSKIASQNSVLFLSSQWQEEILWTL